jgi:RNA-dependent RNA polymerase
MGVLDEIGVLNYGEVFVQCKRRTDRDYAVILGPVIVVKVPCLHPGTQKLLENINISGDILVLNAVDHPELHFYKDVIVFPRRGPRPHPNETSGSDLDGDTYSVIWENSLIPNHRVDPMHFPTKKAREVETVSIADIKNFFVDYIANDNLGLICNAHVRSMFINYINM